MVYFKVLLVSRNTSTVGYCICMVDGINGSNARHQWVWHFENALLLLHRLTR